MQLFLGHHQFAVLDFNAAHIVRQLQAIAFFGEKYGEFVRVLEELLGKEGRCESS